MKNKQEFDARHDWHVFLFIPNFCSRIPVVSKEERQTMSSQYSDHTITILIRILEECLEQDYSAEELRSKMRDMLGLLIGSVNAYQRPSSRKISEIRSQEPYRNN